MNRSKRYTEEILNDTRLIDLGFCTISSKYFEYAPPPLL
jgi:hypothetical protein